MAEDINNLLIKNEITKDYKITDNIFDVKEPHKIDNQLFSAVVHSKRKDSHNDSMISKFQMGEIKVLISVSKLAIGFNSPIADTLINLRPTKIRRLFNQLVFRASTKYEGKTHAEHYDLGNCLLEHGFPEQSYDPPIDKHTKTIIDKALKINELEVMLDESKDDDVEISPKILKAWKEDVRVLNNRRVEDLSLREIKKVYNSETNIYNLIKIALEASTRTSNNRYRNNSYEWICKPYKEKEPTILEWDLVTKLVKKRMNVLLKKGKKITSIHFYLDWLINESHINFTIIDQEIDNPFDEDEIQF
jgi:superfamily II DNA or RNA helicase